ncbi:MAG: 5'/3'-nucleotidase SurE [Gemmataceae bacterium]
MLLLTNDDGIDAPGLQALIAAVERLGRRYVVVAPEVGWSGCGHRVTTDAGLRIDAHAPQRFAVSGTPADCVRLGLHHLAPETRWVLAGVNAGGNLGADVYHSGTVAAAREAALHGRQGIALSHYRRRGQDFDWPRAVQWIVPLLADLLDQPNDPHSFWNVNLPHLENGAPSPAVVFCPLDASPLPLNFQEIDGHWHYNGNYHDRGRQPGSDVDVCFRGHIAATLLRLRGKDEKNG